MADDGHQTPPLGAQRSEKTDRKSGVLLPIVHQAHLARNMGMVLYNGEVTGGDCCFVASAAPRRFAPPAEERQNTGAPVS